MTSTAFSNHSEYEVWSARWCAQCARDELGTAPEGTFCPILNVALLDNRVPLEWTKGPDDPHNRYRCSEFVTGTSPAYPEQWHPHFCLSQNGTVVHRTGCPLAFGGSPWFWSTDKPMDACRAIAGLAGWTGCQYCEPFK